MVRAVISHLKGMEEEELWAHGKSSHFPLKGLEEEVLWAHGKSSHFPHKRNGGGGALGSR